MQTSLHAIAQAARRDKGKRFKSLYSFLNREVLKEAYRRLNKNAAPGVDKVTYEEYGRNLEQNVIDLEGRLKDKSYHAKVVRRVYIPKDNGKTRPLGIPVLEDKMVQWVVRGILQSLFEPLFYKHSYAYRPGRNASQAVEALWQELRQKYRIVVEVDIKDYFGSINHDGLLKMVSQRVNDRSILWLIEQWLKAGILHEDGWIEDPENGTPQGGVISPILANIYLHYVLDQWFATEVRLHSDAEVELVRYADDFVSLFRFQHDADKFFAELKQRFLMFGLELSEEKTRKIKFTRFDKDRSEPFDFLGFTFYWDTSRKGNDVVMTETSMKRVHKTIQTLKEWIRENRHRRLDFILSQLEAKLRGHANYFGRRGNYARIKQVYDAVVKSLFKWLNRRSQRKSYNWNGLKQMLAEYGLYRVVKIKTQDGYQLSFLPRLY